MSSWDRYQAWRLQSRTRFVTTAVGLRGLIVFMVLVLGLFGGSTVGEALLLTATIAVLWTPFFWFWYPRAKAKSKPAGETASSVAKDRMDDDDQLDGMQRFYRSAHGQGP